MLSTSASRFARSPVTLPAALTVRWMAAPAQAKPDSWRPLWVFAAQVKFVMRENEQRAAEPEECRP